MIDNRTPLTDKQIIIASGLGVKLMTNWDNGNTVISKRYWERIRPELRDALVRALTVPSIFDAPLNAFDASLTQIGEREA